MTLVLEISDSVAETLRDFAQAEGEDLPAYATATLTAHAVERPRTTYHFTEAQRAAARAELEHLRPHDPEAVYRKFGITPSKHTPEELASLAEETLASMYTQDKRYLTQQGLL